MLSEKPWRVDKAVRLLTAIIFSFCVGGLTVGVLHRFAVPGFRNLDDPGVILLGTLSFQGVAWVLIGFFLRAHRLTWREAFGFRGPELKAALMLATGVAAAIVPLAWALQIGCGLLMKSLGWEPTVQTAVALLENTTSVWLGLYFAFFSVIIVPVAEEFVFRGLLYPLLKQLGFRRSAWFGVSFVFALIHQDVTSFLPLFVLSLTLIWLYERTDNLLAPITTHALFNATNLAWLFLGRSAVSHGAP